MSSTSTVLSNIFILIGRSRSCILADDDAIAVERFCPSSKVLTPVVFWTPNREPGVCRTLYVPSISPIFQQWAESKEIWKKIEDYSLKDSFPLIFHMKILPAQAQWHTKSLFNVHHPTTKTNKKVDETLVKNPASGKKKNTGEKNQNYSKTWLGNRMLKPVPYALLTYCHFNFRLIFLPI